MEFGSLKYLGQLRLVPVYQQTDQSHYKNQQGETSHDNESVADYEYVKCGYGRLIWPDNSHFEGFWVNGQPTGVGVFRTPEPNQEFYEGFWQ